MFSPFLCLDLASVNEPKISHVKRLDIFGIYMYAKIRRNILSDLREQFSHTDNERTLLL